jgi:hypothetical protein
VSRLTQGQLVLPIHPNPCHGVPVGAPLGPSPIVATAPAWPTSWAPMATSRPEPLGEVTRTLPGLVRSRDDRLQAGVAAAHPLRSLLDAHRPGAIFERLDSEIALARLEDSPTLERAPRPLPARPRGPAQVGPGPPPPPPHPHGPLTNLAQVLAELGPNLDRVTDVEPAAAEGGTSSLPRASGTSQSVGFRWAAQILARAHTRGKRHPHAMRILLRAWLRVMWACWPLALQLGLPPRHQCPRRSLEVDLVTHEPDLQRKR